MKRLLRTITVLALGLTAASPLAADRLVILHSNDTHSQIDPTAEDLGGILRRKVLIDSIRAVEPNVLLVDAGDVVQGTLFFTLYGGEIENALMDSLRYDYRILGNHEFDNGAEELAAKIKNTKSKWISTNYDMRGTELGKKFQPYDTLTVDGRKIGIIALNLQPKGMISEGNYNGVNYLDLYKAANSTAWHLKHNDGCDLVVALTHIGYEPSGSGTSDVELARNSEDIDIIVGGHSHTVIDPEHPRSETPWLVTNAAGRPVLVTQTGKSGRNLGQITVDLDNLTADYKLIPVTKRLDDRIDKSLARAIEPYRAGVDSLMNVPIARTSRELSETGSDILNFLADFIRKRGEELAPGVDFAIINKGGIRRGLPKGKVSEGMIIQMLPFNNRVEVIDVKGSDLAENFDIMARTGGNGVSKGVEVTFDPETYKATSILINGQPLDPEKTYRVATIDYLANGGDYMQPLTRGTKVAFAPQILNKEFISYLRSDYSRKKINPSADERMHPIR